MFFSFLIVVMGLSRTAPTIALLLAELAFVALPFVLVAFRLAIHILIMGLRTAAPDVITTLSALPAPVGFATVFVVLPVVELAVFVLFFVIGITPLRLGRTRESALLLTAPGFAPRFLFLRMFLLVFVPVTLVQSLVFALILAALSLIALSILAGLPLAAALGFRGGMFATAIAVMALVIPRLRSAALIFVFVLAVLPARWSASLRGTSPCALRALTA